MSEVDDRIVSIQFDNENFDRRITETIKSLDALNKTLQLTGATQGLSEISAAADHFDTSHMANAIDNISSKFSALGAIGFSVIQKLTDGVLGFAKSGLDKVLDPILQGGKSRAINLENAKFAFEGLGIDVNKAMASAKEAVLGTAFGLDEAAKAAAVFGGAGIAAGKDMTQALRGIAGVAALTNTSFSEIADIFTASAASGVVNNQDLQQFATRGLDAAATLAKAMHISEAQVHELASEGKISFAQFSKAMDDAFGKHAQDANKTFTGALANMHAAMSRLGAVFFTPALEDLRNLFNAITPAIDKAAVALGPIVIIFTKIFGIKTNALIGEINKINFDNLKKAMENVAVIINNIFRLVSELKTAFLVAFRDIFPKNTVSILVVVTAKIAELTKHFIIAKQPLELLRETFRGVFAILEIGGVIFKEVVILIKNLVKEIFPATGGLLEFSAKLGNLALKLNESLVAGGKIHAFFVRLNEILHIVPVVIDKVIIKIEELANKFLSFFDLIRFDKDKASDNIAGGFGRLGQRADQLSNTFDRLKSIASGVGTVLDKVWAVISKWFSELGQKIADAFKPGDFDSAVDAVNLGLLGGIVILLKKFLDGDLLNRLAPSFIEKVGGMFDQLTSTLKSMQQQVKADTILKIAEAIGIIAISLVALSLIDSKKLTQALIALTVGFGELIGAMAAMDKVVGSNASAIKLGIIGAALIELATASLILVGAVAILAQLDFNQLTRGLGGIAVGLGLLVAAAKILSDSGVFGAAGAAIAGAALIEMATALAILSGVVVAFGNMDLGTLAKGLGAVAVGLAIMVAALKILDAGPLGGVGAALAGAGMILMATALNILAGAVKIFSTMSLGDMAKGLLGVGAGLLIIAGVMKLMPIDLPITAAGLVLVAIALNGIATAVKIMASMSLGELAKGIGAFATMLLILAIGVNAMDGALPGAAALAVVAVSMGILARVLEKIAGIKPLDIIKALAAMAAVIGLFAGLSVLLTEAIVPMIGLGAGLVLIGAGFALLGGGLFLLGKGLEAIANSGVAGAEALVKVMTTLGRGLLVALTKEIEDLINAVPLLIRLIEAVLSQLLDTIIKLAPKLAHALIVLFTEGLKALRTIYPLLIQTGIDLLLALLNGIANNIDKVITAAVNVIVNFINALSDNIGRISEAALGLMIAFVQTITDNIQMIIDAGTNIIIQLLLGITQDVTRIADTATFVLITFMAKIAEDVGLVVEAGTNILINLLLGITNNVQKIIDTVTFVITTIITQLALNATIIAQAGTDALVAFLGAITGDVKKVIDAVAILITTIITEIGKKSTDIVTAGSDALIHFLEGLGAKIPKLAETATTVVVNFMEALGQEIPRFAQAGFDMMVSLLDGISAAIRNNAERMGQAMANLAESLLAGFGNAFKTALIKFAEDELPGGLGKIVGGFIKAFETNSPSKVTYRIGTNVMAGLANGIRDNFDKPVTSAQDGADTIVGSMNKTLANLSDSLGDLGEFNPTITPVLDLTKVQLEATKIDGLMKISAITPQVSTETANQIATSTSLGNQDNVVTTPVAPQEVKFEQNNYSPQALSVNDIYRNTKNQIALAKEELNIS